MTYLHSQIQTGLGALGKFLFLGKNFRNLGNYFPCSFFFIYSGQFLINSGQQNIKLIILGLFQPWASIGFFLNVSTPTISVTGWSFRSCRFTAH